MSEEGEWRDASLTVVYPDGTSLTLEPGKVYIPPPEDIVSTQHNPARRS